MILNQNETSEIRAEGRGQKAEGRILSSLRPQSSAFTLTELLVVITIIAILAGLITGAALNALNKAKQAAITLEMQQLAGAMEDLKNEFGAYPPNVFSNQNSPPGFTDDERQANARTLSKLLRKAFNRSTEFATVLASPPTRNATLANDNLFPIYQVGLSPAEALVFWLQGFSQDTSRPLSGTDLELTSIDDKGTTINNVVTIDSSTPRFDFDRGRLRFSRDGDGNRRFISMVRADGTEFQVQLYEYLPSGSQQPYVYFDTSRETPQQVVNNWEATEFFYSNPTTGGNIYPLKQMRADTPTDETDRPTPWIQFVEYVERDKFQILHSGLDDIWGDFSNEAGGAGGELDLTQAGSNSKYLPQLLAPEGPFIGDIADTLGHFMTGTLEDKQE